MVPVFAVPTKAFGGNEGIRFSLGGTRSFFSIRNSTVVHIVHNVSCIHHSIRALCNTVGNTGLLRCLIVLYSFGKFGKEDIEGNCSRAILLDSIIGPGETNYRVSEKFHLVPILPETGRDLVGKLIAFSASSSRVSDSETFRA